MNANVLNLVYPPENIFIASHHFDDETVGVDVICRVPPGIAYTLKPIPYVTAENYVRCLSQSSYLLAEHILEHRLIPLELPAEEFRRAAADYQFYYRNLAMTFHSRMAPGTEFPMKMRLKNWREIRRLGDFILFTFTNERTVISGEMTFVFVGN